ncbi:MAG: thiamine phosphate synthase [Alicyclobacillus sp.]|nr:thiamine phosphate synthase [Alicyclobacillus sp.]
MDAVLHVLSDRQRHALPLETALVASVRGGADVIQVREKRAPAADIYDFCHRLRQLCETVGRQPLLLVNDRLDVAMAAGADGVHLAAKSLPVDAVRAVAGRCQWRGLLGISVHSVEEALAAAAAGADYVTFGHIYASESHPGLPPRGLLALQRVVEAVDVPVIAIGGIDPHNVGAVLATGCAGVAVIGAVLNHPDPEAATAALKEQMAKATGRPKVPFARALAPKVKRRDTP